MPLFQAVFYSRNQVKMTGGSMRDMVRDILAACNRYDRGSGQTGALIFNEHFFFQAMEGERAMVSDQLWRLAADNRHSGMVLLAARTVKRRAFEGWMVGFAGHSEALDALYMLYGSAPRMDPTDMSVEGAIDLMRAFAELDDSHFVQKSGAGGAGSKDQTRRAGT